MTHHNASAWANDDITNRLKELWKDHSAKQIAGIIWDEFRVRVTRNGVVGKLHRLKLTAENKTMIRPQTTRQHSPRVPRTHRPARQVQRFPIAGTPTGFVDVVMDPLNISFADIRNGQCKSIVNDDLTAPLYCGHWVSEGSHYCAPHRRLFYTEGKRWGERQAAGVDL